MDQAAVDIHKGYPEIETDQRFRWIDRISVLMDSKFRIPGTKVRFGLDPILSLIPIVGNLSTYAVSAMLIWNMYRYGASRKVALMMIGNVVIDTLVGSIPLLGNVFDVFYKANNRNVQLLREHYQQGKHTGSGKGIIATVLLILFAILLALVALIWWLFALVF